MLRSIRWGLWSLAGGCLLTLPGAAWSDEPAANVIELEEDVFTIPAEDAPPGINEETQKLIKAMEKEQREAAKRLDKHRSAAPFQQKSAIRVPTSDGMILGFCVLPKGTIAAISGQAETYGIMNVDGVIKAITSGKGPAKRVQWLDDSGKVLQSAELDFMPKAINSAPDGSVIVVGQGQIARFDAEGNKLFQADSPHMAHAIANREKFEAEVMERHEEEIAQYEEQMNQFTDAMKEVEAKPAKERSQSERNQMVEMKGMAQAYEGMVKSKKGMKKENVISQALAHLKELHRVAISDKYVFVVSNESTGNGYCVWRMPHDFSEAKKVVSKLSGCCGQMDVQVMDDNLAIAENSRHRVLLVDFDGKMNRSFGNTDRTDVTKGFGGCCNPMNTCCDAKGHLLTSESNGLVKLYKPSGEFQSIVGVANVSEGCKNSSIGISPDGNSVYYFDVQKGEILVMKKGA